MPFHEKAKEQSFNMTANLILISWISLKSVICQNQRVFILYTVLVYIDHLTFLAILWGNLCWYHCWKMKHWYMKLCSQDPELGSGRAGPLCPHPSFTVCSLSSYANQLFHEISLPVKKLSFQSPGHCNKKQHL